ncbi:hypothetical protein AQUCO_01700674v1 [Aquilegia coerulea]|uniref:F-box domain-containing protein n=1 Tax=Aquilegia coerulea TaxID=218851 RepID=A0A2G5DP58_AQUCA|nr:hypothetical protein AQUCO_01700674v1 [Aquilegia coerulea]
MREGQGCCIDKKSIIKRRKIEKADDILEKAANHHHIPDDILFDIIIRLPPKSLHRFKSVSKEWCSLIQDQTFQDFYYDRRRQQANETHTIRLFVRSGDHYGFYFIDHAGIASKIGVGVMFCAATFSDPLVPACNGLICFLGGENKLRVWNPATKQIITLPKPDFIEEDGRGPNIRLGFGFDNFSRKFKVVGCHGCSQFQVLTLGDKKWRTVEGSRIRTDFVLDKVIHVNGVLYWVNTRRRPKVALYTMENILRGPFTITSFNLADEKFVEVPIPSDDVGFTNLGHRLCELEGHLCLISHDRNTLDMWVLITSNEQRPQWVNQRIVLPFEMVYMDSILPIQDGEILIQCHKENCFFLCRYNQEGKVLNTTKINGLSPYLFVVGNYVESLVNL